MGDKSPKNKEKRKKKQDNKKKPNVPASIAKTLEKKQDIAVGKDVDPDSDGGSIRVAGFTSTGYPPAKFILKRPTILGKLLSERRMIPEFLRDFLFATLLR